MKRGINSFGYDRYNELYNSNKKDDTTENKEKTTKDELKQIPEELESNIGNRNPILNPANAITKQTMILNQGQGNEGNQGENYPKNKFPFFSGCSNSSDGNNNNSSINSVSNSGSGMENNLASNKPMPPFQNQPNQGYILMNMTMNNNPNNLVPDMSNNPTQNTNFMQNNNCQVPDNHEGYVSSNVFDKRSSIYESPQVNNQFQNMNNNSNCGNQNTGGYNSSTAPFNNNLYENVEGNIDQKNNSAPDDYSGYISKGSDNRRQSIYDTADTKRNKNIINGDVSTMPYTSRSPFTVNNLEDNIQQKLQYIKRKEQELNQREKYLDEKEKRLNEREYQLNLRERNINNQNYNNFPQSPNQPINSPAPGTYPPNQNNISPNYSNNPFNFSSLSPLKNGRVTLNRQNPSLGLINLGYNDFLNSLLQCISHIPETSEELIKQNLTNQFDNSQCLAKEFSNLVLQIFYPTFCNNNSGSFCSPSLLNLIIQGKQKKLSDKNLKDFYLYLIDELHDEMKMIMKNNVDSKNLEAVNKKDENLTRKVYTDFYRSKNNSIFYEFFYGMKKTVNTCLNCKTNLFTFDHFNYLRFSLNEIKEFLNDKKINNINNNHNILSLTDCFDYYNKENLLTGFLRLNCKYCNNTPQDMADVNYIDSAPTIFTILLDSENEFDGSFSFPENLNIEAFVNDKNKSKYYLCGVVTKDSNKSQHYIAYCKMDKNSKWFKYNDTVVEEISNIQEIHNDAVVPDILFYRLDIN